MISMIFCEDCGMLTDRCICGRYERIEYEQSEPSEYKRYYGLYDNIGYIGILTKCKCKYCKEEFEYYYKGGPKRMICPSCGGIHDED